MGLCYAAWGIQKATYAQFERMRVESEKNAQAKRLSFSEKDALE